MGFAKARESRCDGNLGLFSLWATWIVGPGVDFHTSWSEQRSCGAAEVLVNESPLFCQEVAKSLAMQLTYFHGALLAGNPECVPGCELGLRFPCLSSRKCRDAPARC